MEAFWVIILFGFFVTTMGIPTHAWEPLPVGLEEEESPRTLASDTLESGLLDGRNTHHHRHHHHHHGLDGWMEWKDLFRTG